MTAYRCEACGEKMYLADTPNEYAVAIPWTGIEVIVRRWTKEPVCTWCATHDERSREEAIAFSAWEQAHREGYQAGREEYYDAPGP